MFNDSSNKSENGSDCVAALNPSSNTFPLAMLFLDVWERIMFYSNFLMLCIHLHLLLLTFQTRHRSNAWILVFLKTVSDFIIVISWQLQAGKHLELHHFNKDDPWANLLLCILIYGYLSSMLFTTTLVLEKFVYFQYPLHYPLVVTKVKLYKSSVICCLLCLPFSIFFNFSIAYHKKCQIVSPVMFGLGSTLFFVIPTFASFVMGRYLWKALNRKKSFGFHLPRNEPSQNTAQLLKMLVFVFGATAWTVVSLLPFILGQTVSMSNLPVDNSLMSIVRRVTVEIAKLYPVFNPIIIIIIYPMYRTKAKKNYQNVKYFVHKYVTKSAQTLEISTIDGVQIDSRKLSLFSSNDLSKRKQFKLQFFVYIEKVFMKNVHLLNSSTLIGFFDLDYRRSSSNVSATSTTSTTTTISFDDSIGSLWYNYELFLYFVLSLCF